MSRRVLMTSLVMTLLIASPLVASGCSDDAGDPLGIAADDALQARLQEVRDSGESVTLMADPPGAPLVLTDAG
ncbi:MAG: hypothetical protein ACR2HR_18200 [Euzebya sp.]